VAGRIGSEARGLRVPATSVSRRGELTAVYVVKDGRALLRQLRLGSRDGEMIEVLSGLRPGDVVASDPEAAQQALMRQREAAGVAHD
jgi:hypothetical protein